MPSNCLNQCWNIINWTPRDKLQWNLHQNLCIFILENVFEMSSGKWRQSCLSLYVLNTDGAEVRIFWDNYVSTMTANTMAPCVAGHYRPLYCHCITHSPVFSTRKISNGVCVCNCSVRKFEKMQRYLSWWINFSGKMFSGFNPVISHCSWLGICIQPLVLQGSFCVCA